MDTVRSFQIMTGGRDVIPAGNLDINALAALKTKSDEGRQIVPRSSLGGTVVVPCNTSSPPDRLVGPQTRMLEMTAEVFSDDGRLHD